ncbi:unnamed protein product [Ilex paraguariensis]|uniref:BED-type domain-containing protein n=1 Tax=Ilex paraguariensis TaxID=185542 RepID=A0ABC8RP36_9AQUA
MTPKQHDIGWEHATPVGGDRRIIKCNYCGKIVHVGITRMKQHIGHVSSQVEGCSSAPKEVSQLFKQHLSDRSKERASRKKKKELIVQSLRDKVFYSLDDDDGQNKIKEGDFERRQLNQAMKKNRQMAWMEEEGRRHAVSNASSRSTKGHFFADSGPYYQSMIDTIEDASPGIKGPTGYQVGSSYLEEEVQEVDIYIFSMKVK